LLKLLFLFLGVILVAVNRYVHPLADWVQTIIFLAGVIGVGIPHGGADQLIAIKTANHFNLSFTIQKFTAIYCGQILLFLLFFYCLPFLSMAVFLGMAAYHFGETDLHSFYCRSYLDKFLRFIYGLLVLGIILLPNFGSIRTGLYHLHPTGSSAAVIQWLAIHYHSALLFLVVMTSLTAVVSYVFSKGRNSYDWKIAAQLIVLLVILYNLPLLLSFTFYFIIWHSVSSLINMVSYLVQDEFYKSTAVFREIIKNSLIVLTGICFVGFISSFYFKNDNAILCAIVGLAALTGPHMHVMNGMYKHIYSMR
jgi:Brp/Blh family beta-carotene 15,15'-monooxygenase